MGAAGDRTRSGFAGSPRAAAAAIPVPPSCVMMAPSSGGRAAFFNPQSCDVASCLTPRSRCNSGCAGYVVGA